MSLTIKEIQSKHRLSKRSYNICLHNNLLDIDTILSHYIQNGDFLRLRNAGRKTDDELREICQFYIDNPSTTISVCKEDIVKNIEDKFDFLQDDELIQLLSAKFLTEVKKLDQRCQNIIMLLWKKSNSNLKNFIERLDAIGFDFMRVKNVGLKSSITLHSFINYLIDYGKSVKEQTSEERSYHLFIEHVNILISEISKTTIEWLWTQQSNYSNNIFPFSEFIQILFQNGDLLDNRENYIFRHGTKYFHDSKMTLEQLGEKFDITRERVRQILINENFHNSIWNKTIEILQILTPQKAEMEVDFTPDEPFVSFENLDENSLFTSYFYYQLFAKYYTKKYKPVIFEKNIYPKYLIRHDLYEGIRWQELIDTLRPLTEKRNDNEYQINLKGFLFQFIDNEELVVRNLTERLSVLEDLIYEEFGLLTDLDGNLTLKKNTPKLVHEYVIDVLEKANEPLHADEIHRRLELIKPGLQTADSIRGTLQKQNYFVVTDWSTYGLKKWEDEGRYIGGTIKEVVAHYLRMFGTPKHMQDIADFVTQHRDTSKKNIYSNLQSDPRKLFILFRFGFVGLTSKKYNPEDIQFKRVPKSFIWLLQKDYFKENKSIYLFDELIIKFAEANDIFPVQVKSSLINKIEDGKLSLTDNYLYINDK